MSVATFLISALAFFVISFFVEGVWNYYVPVSLVILSFWIISINSQFKSIAKRLLSHSINSPLLIKIAVKKGYKHKEREKQMP
jgi:hypothetical protein